jgi:histidinol-phosphatase (PHP family)
MRMQPEETADYVQTLCALKEEYRGEIDVHIGFEAEYLPTLFDDLLRLLEPHPYEYLVMGQHFLDFEKGGTYTGAATDSEAVLSHYVDQCAEGLNTGAFSCFVHPDLIHFRGDESVYRTEMRRLCREAKACGVPLEYNLLGLGTHRHYPNPIFWEEAAVVGNKVILGWDAHAPSWVAQPELEARGDAFLRSLGLTRIETLTLIRPHAKN